MAADPGTIPAMKHLLLLPLMLVALASHGQERTEAGAVLEFRRVQIGINLSPDICYRTLSSDENGTPYDYVLQHRNEMEIPQFGYTAGLNICYNITRSFGVETGIQYANRGYRTEPQGVQAIDPVIPLDPFIPQRIRYIYDWYYMDIPLRVNLALGKRKLRLLTSVGVTTNVLVAATQTNVAEFADRTTRETKPSVYDYNTINISPTISVGMDYRVCGRMNLRVEPTFRYGVLQIIDAPITGHLYSGGLNVGVYYGL